MAFQMSLGEAKEALSRAKNAMSKVREKAEEAIGQGIEVTEVGGTAFGFGFANAKWGGDDGELKMFGIPVDLGVGIALTGVSMFGGFGRYGEHGVISAGVAALQGGSPIEIAIHATYGAIPIPPGVRQVTDTVLDVVLRLALHGAPLTDIAIHAARDQVPAGIPRDVFDTLIHLVGHHRAIIRAPGALLDHFVRQYAPAGAGLDLPGALVNATHHLPSVSLHPHAPAEHHDHMPIPPHAHGPPAPQTHHEVPPPLALPPGPRMVQPLHLAHA
jgi:hypothetical protein